MADTLDPRLIRAQQSTNTHPGNQQYLQFNTANTTPDAEGRLTWNDTDGTLDLGLKGGNVVLQIGQESVQMSHNASGVDLLDGQAVYISGASGNRLSVNLAQANSEAASSKTFGVVTEPIGTSNNGFVTYSGLVRNIDTSALTEGAAIWLSPTVPGGLTTTKPVAPAHLVLIGWCVRQHATVGMIFVHVANGYELDEIHNVLLTDLADGQVLAYDAASGLWKNSTAAGARATATATFTGVANGATANLSIDFPSSYQMFRIQTSHASRVRAYTDPSGRTADTARPVTTEPSEEVGLVLECVTTPALLAWDLSPAPNGYTRTAGAQLPLAVTNNSGATATITVTFTYLGTEA